MRVSTPRRPYAFAALASLLVLSLSCGGGSDGGPPEPASVVVTPGLDTLFSLNETRVYSVVVLDAVGDPVDGAEVTWSSSDTTVLTVGAASGLVTARQNGAATITASSGDLSGTASAFVTQIVTSVTVTPPNASLTAVGDTVRFTAVARDSGNSVVANAQILWDLNDNTVATIDTLGLATAKGPGIVLVQAQAQARAGYAALSVTQSAAALVFIGQPTVGTAGTVFPVAIQVEIRDSNGHRVKGGSLPVTIAVAGGNGPFGMVGVTTVATTDGVATFQNLGVTRAGALQLTANAPGLSPALSAAVAVTPEVPSQLSVESVADSFTAGDTLQAVVEVQDRFGNLTDVDGLVVKAAMRRELSPGSFEVEELFNDPYAVSVNGVIDDFDGLVIRMGDDWELVVTPAVGSPYDSAFGGSALVVPDVPAATTFWFTGLSAISPWIGVGAPHSPGLTLFITDFWGNPTPTAPPTLLTMEVAWWTSGDDPNGPGGGQALIGTLSGTTTGGQLVLGNVGLLRPGITSLRAVGGGLIAREVPVEARIYGKHGLVAGESHACVIGDGGPYCWGNNAGGRLTGSGTQDSIARHLTGAPALVSVVTGGSHTCGLTAGGQAWCWGTNSSGQLGRGTTSAQEPAPGVVVTAVTFSSLTAGALHTCGVSLADSAAYCWGFNSDAQLGDSSSSNRSVPTRVVGGKKFAGLAAGTFHTCGFEPGTAGQGWCWGRNEEGEGGSGSATVADRIEPTAVLLDSVSRLRAGDGFTCAEVRMPAGGVTVRCWGKNVYGRIPDNSNAPYHTMPTLMVDVGGVRPGSLALGTGHGCVLNLAGQIWCWGANQSEQIQDNGTEFFQLPVQPQLLGSFPAGTTVAPGGSFTCVIIPPTGFGVTVGDTKCWGHGSYLGDGHTYLSPPGLVRALQ